MVCRMTSHPTYILVENVKGFETSEAQVLLVDTINKMGYIYQVVIYTFNC